ncbi:C40 family peptidase [Lentilactobacillus kefiri]|uniref:NLP P60 protein n=2 Tax=Lentilactobacillus kefiri TaxID=33962 RepID=A0A8E1RHS3_LENKE|nr:C40 family peptidase [Lentilactobacillus kefiri]KRL73994.1 NLP P60 protein [Lentilactobacillus parakefiri DSM 10551]KRM50488.1 NLP P60 protein [Lentilactobacillus kefiri DSM 20587 = JCM 5818]MCJ2162554.1 C40 family peptidase [Lentilactobacillus kefiri]MCP9369858.1 C40 family peptidase [Lentilactobacillus kefiri]MDH5109220.1 C40 family peptidase [Lentilactobacillus kefiri]
MFRKHRKLLIITGSIFLVAIIVGIFVKSVIDPDSTPTVVSEVKQDVAPNKIFESYKYRYDLQIIHSNAKLYSAPAGTKGANYLGTAKTRHLSANIVGQKRCDLNNMRRVGYIAFKQAGHQYWISAQNVKFRDLNKFKGTNPKIETAINAGLKLVGKSKYDYGGGRNLSDIKNHHFDCSSFIRYCYGKAGIRLGRMDNITTYTLVTMGKPVKFQDMKRGDIFFFTNSKGQVNSHVALYLGDHLFLHDHNQSDTGGVGISTLNAPGWLKETNGTVRRIA